MSALMVLLLCRGNILIIQCCTRGNGKCRIVIPSRGERRKGWVSSRVVDHEGCKQFLTDTRDQEMAVFGFKIKYPNSNSVLRFTFGFKIHC